MTPREVALVMHARLQRDVDAQNQMAWLAWHIVALGRTKRLPPLERLLVKMPARRRRQTWQEQMAAMEIIAEHARRQRKK